MNGQAGSNNQAEDCKPEPATSNVIKLPVKKRKRPSKLQSLTEQLQNLIPRQAETGRKDP